MTSTGPDEKKSVLGSILKFLPTKRGEAADAGLPKDREAIQAWLITRVSTALSLNPDEIDVRETFSSFGLDSRTAVSLSGDLERWLGRRLPPTLVWDYPTIDALSRHLDADASPSATAAAESHSPVGSQ